MRIPCLWLLLGTSALSADLVLSLPKWSQEARERASAEDWIPGGDLLALEAGAADGEPTEVRPPEASEMTDQAPDLEVPAEYLDAYFSKRPELYLVDPQGLLDPIATKDRATFLKYHANDSEIDFYVFVFGQEQEIPGEVRDEEVSERLFGEGRPAMALFYYLGAPARSEIMLSPGLTDAVSDAERRRILQSSILAAQERSSAVDQLEAFCVQTSIRIYWIEKAAGLVEEAAPVANATKIVEDPDAKPGRTEALKAAFGRFWWKWGAVVSVSGIGLVIAILSWGIACRRARYRFPEFDVSPRLGGSHAAGIGAVIAFGSTTQSPSDQHSGVPDYFGGL